MIIAVSIKYFDYFIKMTDTLRSIFNRNLWKTMTDQGIKAYHNQSAPIFPATVSVGDLAGDKQSIKSPQKIPEILAPAGGVAQFFAALNSGADAVFLGLKTFNARSRAENFTIEELRSLIPIAHQYGMKVLITLNILIKDLELNDLIHTLSDIEDIGPDAIIVQDLGVARIVKKHFPALRLHASTQMAIHNAAGVIQAAKWGFKRVVVARELTAQEIKKIRTAAQSSGIGLDHVELEVFCHGSLCYSYSGLCFFSGAADSRSGNRGECAYTCREPYKVISEPGQGFLFSMRDLDTSKKLDLMIAAGVDTLKIEGRKKDAQYVSSVVRLYRKKLDELFGRSTLRENAPPGAKLLLDSSTSSRDPENEIRRDLALSFQRGTTSFFFEGRYHENVIDLSSPTHLGLKVGVVETVDRDSIGIRLTDQVELHDGLKIIDPMKIFHAKPQDGDDVVSSSSKLMDRYRNEEISFGLKSMRIKGRQVFTADPGVLVDVSKADLPREPKVSDLVYKTRSADLKARVEKLSKPPLDARLRPLTAVSAKIYVGAFSDDESKAIVHAEIFRLGVKLTEATLTIENPQVRLKGSVQSDLVESLKLFGDDGLYVEEFHWNVAINVFVPRGDIKELKRSLQSGLRDKIDALKTNRLKMALEDVLPVPNRLSEGTVAKTNSFVLKFDRIEYLSWFLNAHLNSEFSSVTEIVFEPKKAYLEAVDPAVFLDLLSRIKLETKVTVTLSLPTVVRAWDEMVLRKWIHAAIDRGIDSFEIGNAGAMQLLESWGVDLSQVRLSGDFTLYGLNREAVTFWKEAGLNSLCLSIEDDEADLKSVMAHWPSDIEPVAILYKDTPLFIAEACSLTALHNGCPTSKVCGYRSLEIENSKGERFIVAHEGCKSIVFGKQAYSVADHVSRFNQMSVKKFRLDFLTRHYSDSDLTKITSLCFKGESVAGTHSANFLGHLK